jgi:hypothetical protein
MMISGIYKQGKGEPQQKKRKHRMPNTPKTDKVRKEIRIIARAFFTTWIECTKQFRGDRVPVFIPNALKSDTQPLNRNSLEARMCAWIEQNLGDCQEKWIQILTLLMNGDPFMHHGYGCLKPPTLSWLFGFSNKNEWGINRVLNQEFDWKRNSTFRSEDGV